MAGNLSAFLPRVLAPAWIVLCIALGGAVSSGVLVNGLLQIIAGAIIIALLLKQNLRSLDRPAWALLTIAGAAAALGLLMLIPLPPAIWRLFGGRASLSAAFSLLHLPAPWLPVSLVPDATIAALLALLPPVATFLLTYASPPEGRRFAIIALTAMAFVSVLLGVFQQVGGYNSNLYIYEYSSRGGAVGFFANRNHLATLCLMTMPFLAAFISIERGKRSGSGRGSWLPALSALLLLAVGAIVVQSRAGWILLLPTALACFLLISGRRRSWSRNLMIGTVATVVLAVLLAVFAPSSLSHLGDVSGDVGPRERRAFMSLTWQAVRHFWPIGTGWGSFTQVYPRFENPATITSTYINHAHNDYLEILLENGLGGVVLMAGFVIWWISRVQATWRTNGDPICRAATVSIGVVLAHSFVDYPARTAAIACVTAFCCALTSAPARVAEPPRRGRERTTGVIMLGVKGRKASRAPAAL